MGWLGDILNSVGQWRKEQGEYRGARNITRAHVRQIRNLVEEALEHGKWPPGAETNEWAASWRTNAPILARRMTSEEFEQIANTYRFAEQLQSGLVPGERDFDATSRTVGADRDFFERIRASLDGADAALTATRWRWASRV